MAMWTATVLLFLRLVGVVDDGHQQTLKNRTRLAEAVAVSCSQLMSKSNIEDILVLLQSLPKRNPDIISSAIRQPQGQLLADSGNHHQHWTSETTKLNQIEVPVFKNKQLDSTLEIAFESPVRAGIAGFLALPSVRIMLLASLLNFVGFAFWLQRCFRQFDPSQVVPERVRNALDTLAESVVVLDGKNQIMFANGKFSDATGLENDSLHGRCISDLEWIDSQLLLDSNKLADENSELELIGPDNEKRVFKLNRSEIQDESGETRGSLLCLDDITQLRMQHDDLQKALHAVKKSKAEIAEQNKQLSYLATRDSLTGCFNRRSFFEMFEKTWNNSERYGHSISCIMIDVDHFKSVNDDHGHAMGDEVLKQVSTVLLNTARSADIVCRYGGEEFCVLLPNVGLDGAGHAAERYRVEISKLDFENLSITASLGCSSRSLGASLAEQMLDQADQALYHAKRSGRNRVVRFDQIDQIAEQIASN